MITLLLLLGSIYNADGHARLWDPPSRSTMFRRGFRTPANYDDNQLYCGGFVRQWSKNGGKCGVCGDPWDGPRLNEAGGRYATGIISRRFSVGATIDIDVEVTANHKGWFEFRLCPTNDASKKATHECLDRYPLQLADGTGVRRYIQTSAGHVMTKVKLPSGLECSQCVLQWKYHSGNSWGVDSSGSGCIGCGPQEEFYGCADIAIGEIATSRAGTPSGINNSVGSSQITPAKPLAITPPRQIPDAPVPPAASKPSYIPLFMTPSQNQAQQPKIIPMFRPVPYQGPLYQKKPLIRVCLADGKWIGQTSMDNWCSVNCNRGFCPEAMCRCY